MEQHIKQWLSLANHCLNKPIGYWYTYVCGNFVVKPTATSSYHISRTLGIHLFYIWNDVCQIYLRVIFAFLSLSLCFFFFFLLFAVSCGSPQSFAAFLCYFFTSCCLLFVLRQPQSPICIGLHWSIIQKNNHGWIGHKMHLI